MMVRLVKIWTDTLPKEIYKEHIRTRKDFDTMSLGNSILWQMRYCNVYINVYIRKNKSKILTVPNSGDDVEQQELSCIAGGKTK